MADCGAEFRCHDVLLGKGKVAFEHNRHFHLIVAQNSDKYRDSKRSEKTVLVRHITQAILSKGGRFLRQDSNTKEWFNVPLRDAKEKVGHALRDSAANKTKCFGQILRNAPTTSTKSSHMKGLGIAEKKTKLTKNPGEELAKGRTVRQRTGKRARTQLEKGDVSNDREASCETKDPIFESRPNLRKRQKRTRTKVHESLPETIIASSQLEDKGGKTQSLSAVTIQADLRFLFPTDNIVSTSNYCFGGSQQKSAPFPCEVPSLVSNFSSGWLVGGDGLALLENEDPSFECSSQFGQTNGNLSSDNITVVSDEESTITMDGLPYFDATDSAGYDLVGFDIMDPFNEHDGV